MKNILSKNGFVFGAIVIILVSSVFVPSTLCQEVNISKKKPVH